MVFMTQGVSALSPSFRISLNIYLRFCFSFSFNSLFTPCKTRSTAANVIHGCSISVSDKSALLMICDSCVVISWIRFNFSGD